ncbi:MAG: MFS transporter [Armatimonadetes bacterium]|nr:MFS transporter [Armatimonadota bacterium]
MALRERSLGWQFGLSAYWFATNLKWFILLSAVLSKQVAGMVPGGEKSTAWGTVVMVGAAWALFGPAIFGRLADRLGKWRPFMAIGCAGTVIALFVLSQAPSFWVLVAGYLLLQISDDVAQGPYAALIPGLVPKEQRGSASGIMSLLLLSAQIVGGIGAFVLGDLASIYILIGVVNITCALITLGTVRENPEREPPAQTNLAEAWIAPFRDHDFRWVWFTRFLNMVGFYLIYNYLQYFLADAVGEFKFFGFDVAPVGAGDMGTAASSAAAYIVSAATASVEAASAVSAGVSAVLDRAALEAASFRAVFILLLLISFIGAVAAVVGGRVADKVGRKKVIYVAGALMSLPLFPFALLHNFSYIVVLAIPFAVGYGAYQSADWALASDVMPGGGLAKNMGIWQSCIAAPQIISGLAGRAVDAGNKMGPNLGYTLTFMFATVAFAVGIILIRQVRGST